MSYTFYTMSGLKEYVAAKRIKPLAITATKRHPDFPTEPILSEAGIPRLRQRRRLFRHRGAGRHPTGRGGAPERRH